MDALLCIIPPLHHSVVSTSFCPQAICCIHMLVLCKCLPESPAAAYLRLRQLVEKPAI